MVMDLENIEKRINEIKRVLELISEALPLENEKIEHIFNELTGCTLDTYSYANEIDVEYLDNDYKILTLLIDALIECSKINDKLMFKATIRTVEVVNEDKGKDIVVNMKILSVNPNW